MPFACTRKEDGEFLLAKDWADERHSPSFGKVWDQRRHAQQFCDQYNEITKRRLNPEDRRFREDAINRGTAEVVEVSIVVEG